MASRPRRSFSREFKLQLMRQLVAGEKRLAQVCREHDLCETLVRRWREQYEKDGENAWRAGPLGPAPAEAQARIAALEAALGRAHLENEFLRQALEVLAKKGSPSGRDGR